MTDVRSRSIRRTLGALVTGALVIALAVGGCDWFTGPTAANLPPDRVVIEQCPGSGEVMAGDDVTVGWSEGSDSDGRVVEYQWAVGDSSGTTELTWKVLTDVAETTHTFVVAAVDEDGGIGPPGTCEFTPTAAGGLVDRVVLAEFLTTLPCDFCPEAEEALDRVLAYYGADELTIVSYHDNQGPDPLDTPETVARIYWYTEGTIYEEQYPAVIIDGGIDRIILGAPDPEQAEGWYRIEIDHRRTFGSPITVRLSGEIDGGRGEVTVSVVVRDALPDGDYVLRTVVIEDDIFAYGEDFGFSARDILDDASLTVSAVGDSAVVERSFTVDPAWVIENMDVIAFVQNDVTKEVLQSGRLSGR